MTTPAVHIRFVGLLASPRAEALARECVGGLAGPCGEVARWDVCLQPPLAPWCGSGYVVRVQAWLQDGGTLSIRAQGGALEETVRVAFQGIGELLLQEGGAVAPAPAWRTAVPGRAQGAVA